MSLNARLQPYPASYYAASVADAPLRPALHGEVQADVCVVGAGYTGLYTALRLAEAGKRVVMLDASRVGWGASGRNGGQAILGFSCDMPPIEAQLGRDEAMQIWQLVRDAAGEIRQRIARHQIDCDWQDGHLWTAVLPRRVKLLTDWQQEASEHWGYTGLQFIPKHDLGNWVDSPRYQAALYDPEAGHLHPLKYALGLAAAAEAMGVVIHEHSPAIRHTQQGNQVIIDTENGRVRADALVLAANVYLGDLDRERSRRILPVGTFMVATEPLGERGAKLVPSRACVTDNQFVLDYFRLSSDGRLLFGGGCTYLGGMPRDIKAAMRPSLDRVFPQLKDVKLDYGWGGLIDCTMRRTPDFGQRGNVCWAQGFSGHGVIPTCVAGRVLASAILGDDSHLRRFMKLSNPPLPGGRWLAGPMEAAGKTWYRLRDLF
ncbi:FAD-binding oxidoreductase [Chitinimonas sp. BJYL2]|uniref:NAD(P)/FAD-dependent oxidoreductase n=1 Tax=Chitinimonas sp. BJYL2 TaxID=2976696 RepID=UPI0022B3A456|nr:FAD-binding oxidoreductase [Chitinimonas sp. BJYL2]